MRPPVQILKFLAIESAENRDAEGVEGGRETKPKNQAPAENEFWGI